jgi:hypothetical protein
MNLGARLVALLVFAAAMGWFEAVVVVYIREMLGIVRTEAFPPYEQVMARIRSVSWLLSVEQLREAATIGMLAAVGYLAAGTWRARFGAFLLVFGVWDIIYYVALYALLRWPPSLATWDLLFLIPPGPWWYQPVWAPMLFASGMIGVGVYLMRNDRSPS